MKNRIILWIYQIWTMMHLPSSCTAKSVTRPCIFKSLSSSFHYGTMNYTAKDDDGSTWTCEEHDYTTKSRNCYSFKSNFTHSGITILETNIIDHEETTSNGNLTLSWDFNITVDDNTTTGFYLLVSDVMTEVRHCRFVLFNHTSHLKTQTPIRFQTVIVDVGKFVSTKINPVVSKSYDRRKWKAHFVLKLDDPSELVVTFKTREGISKYLVELLSYPDNKTVSRRTVMMITPVDPKPDGKCICYIGTPKFPNCRYGCTTVKSDVFPYPRTPMFPTCKDCITVTPKVSLYPPLGHKNEAVNNGHEEADTSLRTILGCTLTSACVLVIVIIVVYFKRRFILKLMESGKHGGYKVIYLLYTSDNTPHLAVLNNFSHVLTTFYKCDVIQPSERQTELGSDDRKQLIEESINRCDVIMVVFSQMLHKLFLLKHGDSSKNGGQEADDAINALLYVMSQQKSKALKAKVLEINFAYTSKEVLIENVSFDNSFLIPDDLDLLSTKAQLTSRHCSKSYIVSSVNSLKESVQDAIAFEKANKEWLDTKNSDVSLNEIKLECNDSGTYSFGTNRGSFKAQSVGLQIPILQHSCGGCLADHLQITDMSEINFVPPDCLSDPETGSFTFSEKIRCLNCRYEQVIANPNVESSTDGGHFLRLCNECISLDRQSV